MNNNSEKCIYRKGDLCYSKERLKYRIGGSGTQVCVYHLRDYDIPCSHTVTKTIEDFLK